MGGTIHWGGWLNTQKREERGHIGRKERGDGQDVTEGTRSPDKSWRGEKEGTTSSSTGKHRNLILRGQSLGIVQADVRDSESNHPIMDKLGVLEARPTDRQTDR